MMTSRIVHRHADRIPEGRSQLWLAGPIGPVDLTAEERVLWGLLSVE